jgi:hypothetical protein
VSKYPEAGNACSLATYNLRRFPNSNSTNSDRRKYFTKMTYPKFFLVIVVLTILIFIFGEITNNFYTIILYLSTIKGFEKPNFTFYDNNTPNHAKLLITFFSIICWKMYNIFKFISTFFS